MQDCNCGAQDRAEHRPHARNCAVYQKSKSKKRKPKYKGDCNCGQPHGQHAKTCTIYSRARRLVAHLCCMHPSEIDGDELRKAAFSARRKDTRYWDAMANANQLDGNVPYYSCVAIVYHRG